MGAASCKNSKSSPQNQQKEVNKNITIGVFGLDDAGKTSTVKAIEGVPTDHVLPTMSSNTSMVTHPFPEKNKNQQRIQVIDLSGKRKFRQQSWSQYYDQIHGLIFVIDASEKNRLNENQETLEDLLENDKIRNKPILILANKQDQKGAINNENDLKRKLDIERLKTKYKIELCTALPQGQKNRVDESIRKGFVWLIRTIEDNYTELNSLIKKENNTRINSKFNRSESDENISDNKYSKEKNTNYTTKNTDYRSKITSEKLPSINTNRSKTNIYSDNDDDDDTHKHIHSPSTNDFLKKKKALGNTNSNDTSIKRLNNNEPQAFRSTFETFPEETPWTSSSTLKKTKSDDVLPRLYTKPSLTNDTRKRDISPLVRDTKSYTNGSISKRDYGSDNDEDFSRQQKTQSTSRFDNSTNRFSSTTKKPTSSIYNNDDDDDDDYTTTNNRRIITTPKKTYNRNDDDNDDDENDYLKRSTTTKSTKPYDYNDNNNYHRSSDRLNLNSEYRGTLSKSSNQSKFNDDDYSTSYSRKDIHSKFNNDDYATSKSTTHSTYNNTYPTSKSPTRSRYNDDDDDEEDTHRWSSSKPITSSKYNDDDYKYSSSKITTHSKFEDDDYPSSSMKTTIRSKYEDDDDDDDNYSKSSKRNNYSGNNNSRSRYEDDDFFTSKGGSNTTNRFRKNTDYDS